MQNNYNYTSTSTNTCKILILIPCTGLQIINLEHVYTWEGYIS